MAVPAAVLIGGFKWLAQLTRRLSSARSSPRRAALQLGTGRARATDGGDFAVGFDRLVKCGEPIHVGQAVCRIHARTAVDLDMVEAMIEKAVKISAL